LFLIIGLFYSRDLSAAARIKVFWLFTDVQGSSNISMNTLMHCIRNFGLAATMMLFAAGASAQTPIQVRIQANAARTLFFVDNVPYTSGQVFSWQINEVHLIRVAAVQEFNDPSLGLNAPPLLAPGIDAGLGVRHLVSENPVTVEGPAPLGAVVVSTQANGTSREFLIRVQVYDQLKTITINSTLEYRLRFRTPAAGCAPSVNPTISADSCQSPNSPAAPGYTVVTGVQCTPNNIGINNDLWCGPGRINLTSIPNLGYAYKDWNSNPAIPGQNPVGNGLTGASGSATFDLVSPFHIQVNFGQGKFYRLRTEPPGLDVIVDRNIVRTRQTEPQIGCQGYLPDGNPPTENDKDYPYYEVCATWLVGSTKLLSAPGPTQTDNTGKLWVFDRWSNGGSGQNYLFPVSGDNLATDLLTAIFKRAGAVLFNTLPIGAPITVNGRTWPTTNHWFGLGDTINFSAPPEFVDRSGKRWRFRNWSNNRPAAQQLTISDEIVEKGLYLNATFDPLNRVTIETNPSGLPITVDGRACPAPCTVERLALETAVIAAAPSITQRDVLRLEFDNWSDGPRTANRSLGFEPEFQRLIANYRPLYKFSAIGNPPEGATFTFAPASPDSFYPVGTQVSVTARALPGFRFRRWAGDTAGQFPTASVTLGGPRGVVAELDVIPYLDPAGVQNSAGTGPQDKGEIGRVAPGSLITVYGVNLTPLEEVGPRSPMVQSLAGLLVRVGEQLLPLSFASPTQINAQLPFNLPEGKRTLTVTRVGQPDVTGEFEVVRNAPGLFTQYGNPDESQPPIAFAFRPDGSLVSPTNPALPNELINIAGTGIGPYRNNPPAGFAVPSGAEFVLADSVEVLAGEQVIQPLRVIATPGFVGMTSVQIRVGSQFPAGQSTSLRIRVNGKESNTVRLPVR
jgi:uncharacterized protein (TIGR03437 family)